MDIKLVVQTGEREGQELLIDGEELVIGRDRTCQFRIDHYLVSPRHCRIRRDGHRACVEDLHSATGTEVNDQPIDTGEIRDGDLIKVGPETFLVAIVIDQDGPSGSRQGRPRSVDGNWTKLRVIDNRGIATVYFDDVALINEIEILEVDRELGRLIEMGYNRIALNLGNLAHLSSQVIGTMLKVHRQCTAGGGVLKICQIHPDVIEIFALTGVYRTIEIYPTESMVLGSDWPGPSRLKPPQAAALVTPAGEQDASSVRPSPMAQPEPPTNGVGHTRSRRGGGDRARREPATATPDPESAPIPLDDGLGAPPREHGGPAPRSSSLPVLTAAPAPSSAQAPRRAQLIVLVGRTQGQAVNLSAPRFLIGRDPICHLRAASPAVRPVHAIIEQRDGRVFLRDGSHAGGLTLNDRPLDGTEVEAVDGDILQVGPLRFAFAVPAVTTPAPTEAPRPLDLDFLCPNCRAAGRPPINRLEKSVPLNTVFNGWKNSPGRHRRTRPQESRAG